MPPTPRHISYGVKCTPLWSGVRACTCPATVPPTRGPKCPAAVSVRAARAKMQTPSVDNVDCWATCRSEVFSIDASDAAPRRLWCGNSTLPARPHPIPHHVSPTSQQGRHPRHQPCPPALRVVSRRGCGARGDAACRPRVYPLRTKPILVQFQTAPHVWRTRRRVFSGWNLCRKPQTIFFQRGIKI